MLLTVESLHDVHKCSMTLVKMLLSLLSKHDICLDIFVVIPSYTQVKPFKEMYYVYFEW